MQKTIHFALFLFIVTGLLFTGCAKTPEDVEEEGMGGSLEESLTGGDVEESEDEEGESVDFEDYDGTLDDSNAESTNSGSGSGSSSDASSSQESAYVDGTYTEVGSYSSPAGQESISVTLSLKDGVVESVKVSGQATNETSKQYQALFAEGVSAVVVGKSIDSLGSIGAVNGSSLTPKGFSAAVKVIMNDAENA